MNSLVLCAIAILLCSTSCTHESGGPPLAAAPAAARTQFTFDAESVDQLPRGWMTNEPQAKGALEQWSVIADATAPSKPNVLSLSNKGRDSGLAFNLCWNQGVRFQDGRVEISLKANGGQEDQGGGPIWRVQDKDNYYVCRVNPLENNFRVYYVKGGSRTQLATADVRIPTGQWQRIAVEQHGRRIVCFLNGASLLDVTDDHISGPGGVGVWTKADAASSFDDITLMQ